MPDPLNVFAAGRVPQTARRTQQLIFGALVVLAIATLITALSRRHVEREAARFQRQGALAQQWVEEWRRTSDELTRFARTYAITGDAAFGRYYQSAIAIRDGLKPRPAGYDKVYWDLVIALGREPEGGGTIASLESLMERAGLATNELARLEVVRTESARLGLLEQVALNAMQGRYRDAVGRFTLTGAVNRAYAVRMLHGPEYHQAKARLMDQVRQLQVAVDGRVEATNRHWQNRVIQSARLQTVLGVSLVIGLVGAFILLNRRLLEPLAHLGSGAAAAARGGLFRRLTPTRKDELGVIANGLNQLADTVEAKSRELAGHQERFRQLLDAVPDAVITTDGAGVVTGMNRSAEALFGVSAAEATGKALAGWQSALAALVAAKTTAGARELTLRTRAGADLETEVFVQSCELADAGRMVCLFVRDRTREQTGTRAAELRSRLFVAALDAVPDAVIVANVERQIVAVNRSFETLTGLSRDVAPGKVLDDLDFLSDGEHTRVKADLSEAIRSGQTITRELRLLARDGFERRMSLAAGRLQLGDNSVAGVVMVLTDQSGLRRAESEATKQRQLLQGVIDQFDGPAQVKDVQGRFLLVNRRYEQLTKQPMAALIGRSAAEAFGRTAARESEAEERQLRQTRQPLDVEFEGETADGKRHFAARKFPVVAEDGELLGTAEVCRDVSRLRQLEHDLAQVKSERDRVSARADESVEALAMARDEVTVVQQRCARLQMEADQLRVQLAEKQSQEVLGVVQTPEAPKVEPDTFEESAVAPTTSEVDVVAPESSVAPVALNDGEEPAADESEPVPAVEAIEPPPAAIDDDQPAGGSVAETSPGAGAPVAVEPALDQSKIEEPEPAVETPAGLPSDDAAIASDVEPAATSAASADAVPAKRKRAPRKKKPVEAQADLFGNVAPSSDDSSSADVHLDADGVPAIPGMDLRDAQSRLELSATTLRQMVVHFAEGLPQTFAELRAAVTDQDSETARRLAHSLAGAAGSLSADALRRLAKTLELALKFEQGDTQRMLVELEHEAARLIAGIRRMQSLEPAAESSEAQALGRENTLPAAELRRLRTLLEELSAALEAGDQESIAAVAAQLKKQSLPGELVPDYEQLSEAVDASEYAEAAEHAQAMLRRLE